MGQALFTNNAFSTLASGITDVATTLTVAAADGALFPNPTGSDYFYATLIDTSNNLEIVKCTARSTDVFTIVREQEGTTGRAYSAADRIELRLTAAGITEADGYVFTADESTDTTCFPLFVTAATGSQLPFTGTNLTFNSSTGALVSTLYDGIIGSVTPAAISATTVTTSGVVSVDDVTDSTSGTTGSIHTDGGIGIVKKLFVGGTTTHGGDVLSDTDSTDSLGSTSVRWLKLWVDSIQTTANTDVAGDLTVTGDLTVNGTTSTVGTTNTVVKDSLVELANGTTGSPTNDAGIVIERGSADNAFMGWDESEDKFVFVTTTMTGADTGNLDDQTDAQITAAGAAFSGTSSNLGTVTTIDINGGTVDGAVIGGSSAAAVTGTTVTGVSLVASQDLALATGATVTGIDNGAISTGSATLLATQGAIDTAINSSSKAAGISMTWETTTTDTDQGVGKVWANHGTLSSATVLYFDDVERNSVSINALIDSLDDPTATNSATIYIQEAGTATAGVVFKCSGAVTSASTYSKVAVTHLATFGTLLDGDVVGVTFAFSGDDGGGLANVVEDTTPQLGGDLDCNGSQVQWSKGADVASASALPVLTDGNYFDVTGTTTVTSINTTGGTGTLIKLHFDAAVLLTHHATNLILAGGANITTAAGDEFEFVEYDTGKYRMTGWSLAGTAPGSILKADTADVLTAGFAATIHDAGTKSSGTYTPDEADGNMQKAVNGGAHTLAPPANDCTLVIQYTNNGSAGAITTSGFTVVDGDSLTTTNGHDFFLYITNSDSFSLLTVKALQ